MLESIWYGQRPARLLLVPLSLFFCGLVWLRRRLYRWGWLKSHRFPVPIIIVGNITVGGTGKTPLITWLVDWLKAEGYRPGLVARGYRGKARSWPQQVRPDSDPVAVGDEPVLLARRTGCPMAVGPDRAAAVRALLEHNDCDVVISDDGLQHYALARDIEIVVIDGVRRLGNGWCLPAGPLRESTRRLSEADIVIANGVAGRGEFGMSVKAGTARNLLDPSQQHALTAFQGPVQALAAIGNPERFFAALRQAGVSEVAPLPFPDHHVFSENDLDKCDADRPVLVTEKDAVKLERFARPNFWYVPASVSMDDRLAQRLKTLLNRFQG